MEGHVIDPARLGFTHLPEISNNHHNTLRHISLPNIHPYLQRGFFQRYLIKSLLFPLSSSSSNFESPFYSNPDITKAKAKISHWFKTRHLCAFDAELSCVLLPQIAMMILLSDIVSASAHLHHSNHLPSDEYDRRIRELVEYLRRLQTTKALDSCVSDESVLNVSSFIHIKSSL